MRGQGRAAGIPSALGRYPLGSDMTAPASTWPTEFECPLQSQVRAVGVPLSLEILPWLDLDRDGFLVKVLLFSGPCRCTLSAGEIRLYMIRAGML